MILTLTLYNFTQLSESEIYKLCFIRTLHKTKELFGDYDPICILDKNDIIFILKKEIYVQNYKNVFAYQILTKDNVGWILFT